LKKLQPLDQETEIIRSGATFQGATAFIGLILIILGIFNFFSPLSIIFSFALLYAGSVMFLSIRGYEFNYRDKTIRHYFSWFFFKTGNTNRFSDFHRLTLSYHNESSRMSSRGRSQIFEIRDFEIKLHFKSGESLLITQFKQYRQAREFTFIMSEKLGIESEDLFEPVMKSMAEHRYQRRR
jgi:hypothetical protein